MTTGVIDELQVFEVMESLRFCFFNVLPYLFLFAGRGKPAKKSKAKFQSDNESSGEEWGAKKGSAKKGKKRANDSSDDDSDYEKPKKKAAPRKKKAPGEKGARKAGGYTAPVKLSEELADIVGGDEMPRHEVRE